MTNPTQKQIARLINFVADLGDNAAGRGDTVNEAYLKGVAEGLRLADMMENSPARLMTQWSQFLVNQAGPVYRDALSTNSRGKSLSSFQSPT